MITLQYHKLHMRSANDVIFARKISVW